MTLHEDGGSSRTLAGIRRATNGSGRILSCLLIVGVLSACVAQQVSHTAAVAPPDSNATLERSLLHRTNAARAEVGKPPLEHHEGLAEAARLHAAEMAALGFLSHASPDPDRETVGRRLSLAGVALVEHGENVARVGSHMDVARETVDGWLASPGHRDNLLSEGFTHVGFGTATADDGSVYVAQVLAARPIERREATATPVTETVHRWTLDLYARESERVALFVDGRGRTPRTVSQGRSTIPVELEPADGRRRVEIGASLGGGRYQLQDAAWLDPETGEMHSDGSTPGDRVRLESASMERVVYHRLVLDLRYDGATVGLALYLDGRYQPAAEVSAGHLRAVVPVQGPNVTVEVGIAREGEQRARVVERFVLIRDEEPELRAAAP